MVRHLSLLFPPALALIAQAYLVRGTRTVEAWLLYGLAGALAIYLWRGGAPEPGAPPVAPACRTDRTEIAGGLLALALAAAAAAAIGRTGGFNDGLLLYAVAGGLLAHLWLRRHALPAGVAVRRALAAARANRVEILAVAALVLYGAAFRIYGLDAYPPQPGAISDEWLLGGLALRMVNDPSFRPIYAPMGGSVNLYHPIAVAFALFGADTFTLRLPSIIAGILTLVPFYAVARQLYSRRIALVCLALFAFSFWHNNVGRFAFDWIYMGLFAMLSVCFLLRGQRTGSWLSFAAAGICLGAGVYGYAAFRLFPIVIGLYLVNEIVFVRGYLVAHGRHLLVFVAVFALVAGPNLAASSRPGDQFGDRTSQVIGPALRSADPAVAQQIAGRFVSSAHKLLGRFERDWPAVMSGNRPLLDPIVAALFVLGLVYCSVYFWRRQNALLAGTTLITFAVGGALPVEPYAYRYFAIIPFVYLLAGAAIERLSEALDNAGQRQALLNGALAALVVLSGTWNAAALQLHMNDCSAVAQFVDRPTLVMDYIRRLGPGYYAYIISEYPWHFAVSDYQWLTQDTPVEAVDDIFDAIPSHRHGERNLVYIATDPVDRLVGAYLQHVYPDGVLETLPATRCTPYRFTAFRVSRASADALAAAPRQPAYGLRGRYYQSPGFQGAPAYERIDPPYKMRFETSQRLSIIWDAELIVETPGRYVFSLAAAKEASLFIGGRLIISNAGAGDHTVPASGAVELAAGAHQLTIRYDRYVNTGMMQLLWTPPGGSSDLVPLEALRPATVR